MRSRILKTILAAALFALSAGFCPAQDYVAPEVKISKEKVVIDGKVYISHVVEQKQTLWSICKAYEVSAAELFAANPTLDIAFTGLKAGQILMVPTKETAPEAVSEDIVPEPEAVTAPLDTFVYDIPERISLALILPFSNSLGANEGNVNFYSGVLMACRELGNRGVKVDLNVCNTSEQGGLAVAAALNVADVAIGPVAAKEASDAASRLHPGQFLVSPLDPKAAGLADSLRIIQAPSGWEAQTRDMVEWAAEEIQPGDTVLVVSESAVAPSVESKRLLKELDRRGIRYAKISYGILQGLSMAETFENRASRTGTTRIFAASENEAFVGDVIRQANLLVYKEFKATVYCPSKVRSFDLVDVESFHNVNLRLSTTYFVDYTSADTKAFIMAYRALFGAEPDSYAYQGYDTAMYFVSACAKYGRGWIEKIGEYPYRGLQTDFRFEKSATPGRVNSAVRRVIYNSDFSITVL